MFSERTVEMVVCGQSNVGSHHFDDDDVMSKDEKRTVENILEL